MSLLANLAKWLNYVQVYKWVSAKLSKLENMVSRHEIHDILANIDKS